MDTTTEQDYLLRAILTNPADDTVRLAYADWLDENAGEVECKSCFGSGLGSSVYGYDREDCSVCNGSRFVSDDNSERAKFIRDTTGRWERVFRRKDEILSCISGATSDGCWTMPKDKGGSPYWAFKVGDLQGRALYRLGFVSEIHLPLAIFMDNAQKLFSSHPITKVTLTDRVPYESVTYPGLWRWWSLGEVYDHADCLGSTIYSYLKGTLPSDEATQPFWSSREEAIKALSDACVNYGRSLAELPLLEVVS